MNYTNLGTSGLRVSRICLGMMGFGNESDRPWVIDEEAAEPIVRTAVEGGVTFFDTADAYSGRRERGGDRAAGPEVPQPGRGGGRHQGVHAGDARGERRRARAASTSCRASTRRCAGSGWTTSTCTRSIAGTLARPIEETMEALHDVVRSGKARYIGASSMFAWQFAKAQHTAEAHGWTKFVSMQNHYNLIYREEEREMIPLCLDQGVGCIPWSPLARGVLAGNRTRDGGRHTTRSSTDTFTDYLYDQPTDFDVVDAAARGGRGTRRADGAGGPGLAALQARGDGTHRRIDQEEAPEGRPRRRGADPGRGRDRRAREAVRAAPGARALLGAGTAGRSTRVGPPGEPRYERSGVACGSH